MSTKVHSQGNVPFLWEDKPGIPKTDTEHLPILREQYSLKLRPPPCPVEKPRESFHNLQIPLPPSGAFQAVSRSNSRRGLNDKDDPFVRAYKECTKRTESRKKKRNANIFSCKRSCSVIEESIVSTSRHAISKTSI